MKISIDNDTRKIYFENDVYDISVSLLSFIFLDLDKDNCEHPYIKLFQTNKKTLAKLQEQYGEMIIVCLYLDPLKGKPSSNGSLFSKIESPIMRLGRYYMTEKNTVKMQYQAVEVEKRIWHLLEVYDAPDLSTICYIEFMKMVQFGLSVRKCQNCRQYFIPKGDYDTRYCDRIAEGSNKRTCQQIGAVKIYQKKIAQNPILNEYRKSYRRLHARKHNGTITSEQFTSWTKEAVKVRDKAMQENMTLEQFKEEIESISI